MKNFIEKNYYEILDINPTSHIEEVHSAYRIAVNTYNADNSAMYSLLTSEECKDILNKIEEAYSVIGDPEKKIQYDNTKGFELNQIKSPKQDESFSYGQKENLSISKTAIRSKFSLSYKTDENFEKQIESTESFTGDFLKTIREYKSVTLERMSDLTKVSKTHLKHIEEDMIEKLPADVYTRGFVFQYAKALKLNPELVSTSYMQHTRELKSLLNE